LKYNRNTIQITSDHGAISLFVKLFYDMKNTILFLLAIFLFNGCIMQLSTLKKENNADIPSENYAVIKYFGEYRMNMGLSKDIIITIVNLETGKEYWPKNRNAEGLSIIKAPAGKYVMSKLIIREPSFTRCLCQVKDVEKLVYGFTDRNCLKINVTGLIDTPLKGGLLVGEKYLLADKLILQSFEIENGLVYNADSLAIRGEIEKLYKDLPNLQISQSVQGSSDNRISFFTTDVTKINRKTSQNTQ